MYVCIIKLEREGTPIYSDVIDIKKEIVLFVYDILYYIYI